MYRMLAVGMCAVALIGCGGPNGTVQKDSVSSTIGDGVELVVLNLPGMT